MIDKKPDINGAGAYIVSELILHRGVPAVG
jgi:hypothetical protein